MLQVGELYSSCHGKQVHAGRQSLAFHLNARPSAVLNFHDVLEDAGHFVSERWARQNMCSLSLDFPFSLLFAVSAFLLSQRLCYIQKMVVWDVGTLSRFA